MVNPVLGAADKGRHRSNFICPTIRRIFGTDNVAYYLCIYSILERKRAQMTGALDLDYSHLPLI